MSCDDPGGPEFLALRLLVERGPLLERHAQGAMRVSGYPDVPFGTAIDPQHGLGRAVPTGRPGEWEATPKGTAFIFEYAETQAQRDRTPQFPLSADAVLILRAVRKSSTCRQMKQRLETFGTPLALPRVEAAVQELLAVWCLVALQRDSSVYSTVGRSKRVLWGALRDHVGGLGGGNG